MSDLTLIGVVATPDISYIVEPFHVPNPSYVCNTEGYASPDSPDNNKAIAAAISHKLITLETDTEGFGGAFGSSEIHSFRGGLNAAEIAPATGNFSYDFVTAENNSLSRTESAPENTKFSTLLNAAENNSFSHGKTRAENESFGAGFGVAFYGLLFSFQLPFWVAPKLTPKLLVSAWPKLICRPSADNPEVHHELQINFGKAETSSFGVSFGAPRNGS
ncbi:hypothetical protein DFH09DRAFT_1089162 [Mycena vulgaris]|nr:hypothetical protein DFH09DRAFT_1089162 [Mycena vulgaris]